MAQTPLNKRDIDLQALDNRLIPVATNFISLASPYLEFKYGGDNLPSPATIKISAQLAGDLKGNVTFSVTGLKANTTLNVTNNKLTLDPSTFSAYSVTVTASLDAYTSNEMVISKNFTNLLTRLTRTYDSLAAASDGTDYRLPTASNTLELYNGTTKITGGDVRFGIQGITANNTTVDGLKLTINSTTGAITLENATAAGWTSDIVIFTLVAKFGVDEYPATYTISKIRADGALADTRPPPTPNLTVTTSSSLTTIFVNLASQPIYSEGHGHDVTLVYAVAYTNNYESLVFENARLLEQFPGTFGSFNSDPAVKWKIWLKWKSIDGVTSVNPQGPFTAETGSDVTKLVEALTGPGKPFTVLTEKTVVDGIEYEPGTYTTKTFIIDAQITGAKIANLAVDNSKIQNLDAAKLTVGDGTVGGNLKSSNYNKTAKTGWFIGKDGTADFDAAVIRGTLKANQIDAKGLSIYGADGTLVLNAGKSIQDQIYRYVPDATSGTSLNMDTTCSLPTAWDKRNIVVINDGASGRNALAGRSGEFLLEGAPNDGDVASKAFRFTLDPLKRYQISALIRKVGIVNANAATHLGLLEFDKDNAARYDWGGYLYGKILASALTTEFKRYYVYIPPGELNDLATTAALHVILGYIDGSLNAYTGRIEIQDIRVDDITTPYNIYTATLASGALDATTKSNAVKAEAKTYTDAAKAAAIKHTNDNSLLNSVNQIIKTGFFLRTDGYNGRTVNGVFQPGTGFALYDGGFIAKKNGVDTLAIKADGSAVFSGTLKLEPIGATSYLSITNEKLEVWNSGKKRVVLGKLD